jgi:hypothetical protein
MEWILYIKLFVFCSYLSFFRHILPKSLQQNKGDYDEMMKSGHPIVLYLHGNAHTRYIYIVLVHLLLSLKYLISVED